MDAFVPETESSLVERDHLLKTLAKLQNGVVFIEGESGCGSTTLLAQFQKKYPTNSFALFVRPASKLSYSPDYLRLILAEQFAEFLRVKLSSDMGVDESEYRSLLLALRRRKSGQIVYFLIDGLQQIPTQERGVLEDIFKAVLPLGVDGFRLLIVGDSEVFGSLVGKISSKSYVIPEFSPQETEFLFSGIAVSHDELKAIHRLCSGLPGRLSAVRRMIASGKPWSSVLASDPSSYLGFIEIELAAIDSLPEIQAFAVAALAFSRQSLDAEALCTIFSIEFSEVNAALLSCGFLSEDPKEKIRFHSETHRRAAERKLAKFKGAIFDAQIEHLTKNPNTFDAIEFLPSYMQAQQKLQAIIDLLQPEHYEKLLNNTKSLARLRARAGMGAKSALELNRAREIFQFSLQKSIFLDLATADDCQAQVSALVALGQADRALDLASQASSTEARLRMLAAYGRGVKQRGDQLDSKVVDHIRELSALVDLSESADEAERLAENVAAFDPDLAITILDKPIQHGDSGSTRNEALAKFSITAALSGAENSGAILEKTSGQITDEKLKALVIIVADFYQNLDLLALKKLISPMQSSRRVYFLRGVILMERDSRPCLEIVDLALNELVSSTSYVQKLKDFADISSGLKKGGGQATIEDLIGRIDSQLGLARNSGSTADYVRVQMNIARAQISFNREAAVNRILSTFDTVIAVDLPEIKVESLAIMSELVAEVDEAGIIEKEYGVSQLIRDELSQQMEMLQRETAAHFELLKGALAAMAKQDPESACLMAVGLNTQLTRDSALKLIAQTMMFKRFSTDDSEIIKSLFEAVSCGDTRTVCLRGMIRSVPVSVDPASWINYLKSKVISYPHGNFTCDMAVELAKHQVKYLGAAEDDLVAYIMAGADALSDSVDRIDALYSLVAIIAASDLNKAAELYEQTKSRQSSLAISAPSASRTVRTCLSLLLRGFRGLLKFDKLDGDYILRFSRLCDSLEDAVSKVAYLSDLAARAWCEGKVDMCRHVLSEYVRPSINSCPPGSWTQRECRRFAFTPYFLSRGSANFEMLVGLSRFAKDDVLESTVLVLLRKVSDGDHWTGEEEGLVVSLEEVEDVLELISEMHTDSFIYQSITALCKALSSKGSRVKVASHQRADVKARLEKIIDERLPDKENIRHEGYRIAARARVQSLVESRIESWAPLLSEATALVNSSDRILVQMEIAECMPEKFRNERKRILAQLQDQILRIPSAYDRFWRTQSFAEIAKTIDPPAARLALNTAFEVTFELGSLRDAEKYRRRIVNIAEMIDPKFADSFVQSIDDDPARAAAKDAMKLQSEINKTKKSISSPKRGGGVDIDLRNDVLPPAAWKAVGSLVSGKSAPLAPDLLDKYVDVSGNWDMHDAFPVFSWYIENLSRKLNRSVDVNAKLTPLIETILLSTELAVSVIGQVAGREKLSVFQLPDNSSGLLMRVGEVGNAAEFIFSWLADRAQGLVDVVLCDPYFGASDLWFVKRFGSEFPECELRILTSAKAMKGVSQEDLDLEWRKISDQYPPLCSILIVRTDVDERSPIHDRWLLLENAGLRLGTSLNGMGSRLSEISEVEPERASSLGSILGNYLAQKRLVDGRRLEYSLLKLG